jgi:DNA adenine methylase
MIEPITRLSNIAQRYEGGKEFPELLISNYDTTERARQHVQLSLFDDEYCAGTPP